MKIGIENKIKYAGLIVFLVTAYFSIGHHQSDEHYQILEFAQYKLGHINGNDLPWEFHEKMRPSMQPWIAFLSIKCLNFIKITNPFTITILFRMVSALFLWLAITSLSKVICEKYFPEKKWSVFFYCCALLLWFVPYTSVRFSSENYSAAFLLFGLYFLLREHKSYWSFFCIGALFGLSVLFRYQLGIAIFGIFLWLFFKAGITIPKLIPLFVSFLVIIAVGVYLDYLFYNELVFTSFNYLKLNLIEGKSSNFGTSPWWYYLFNFLLFAIPPISLILLVSFPIGIWKLKNDVFTWCIIPFLLIHFLIPHKEMRFFFPVSYLFVFISIYGLREYFQGRKIKGYQLKLFKVSAGINFILLLFMMFWPANEKVVYYKYLFNNIDRGNRTIITTKREIYELMSGLKTTFYTPDSCHSYFVKSEDELSGFLKNNSIDSCFYVNRHFEFNGTIEGYNIIKVYSVYPDWIKNIKGIDWQKTLSTTSIYLLTKR